MSDLAATNCQTSCNNGCGCGNNSCLWIILLLLCCGNGTSSFGGDGCGCESLIWILLLLCFCGNNSNGCGLNSIGCGCGC